MRRHFFFHICLNIFLFKQLYGVSFFSVCREAHISVSSSELFCHQLTLLHDRQFHLPNNRDNDTTHAVYGGLNNLVRKRQVELSACQAVQ